MTDFLIFLILLEHIKGDQDQWKELLEKSVRGWEYDDALLNTYTTPWCTVEFSPCVRPVLFWGTEGCAGDQIQIVISAFGRGHWLDVHPRMHAYDYEYEERFMTDTNKHVNPPHGLLLLFCCIRFQCYCKMINDFIFGGLDHEKEILSVWLCSLKPEGVGGSLIPAIFKPLCFQLNSAHFQTTFENLPCPANSQTRACRRVAAIHREDWPFFFF